MVAASVLAAVLRLGTPSYAQEWDSGWVPVYEDYARGWGSNRPFWWSDLGPTPYWGGTSFDSALGWPYNTRYGPASTYTYRVAPAAPGTAAMPAPVVVTGQNGVTEGIGIHCSTPAKTCVLRQASVLGAGCSCKATGGLSRGSVTP